MCAWTPLPRSASWVHGKFAISIGITSEVAKRHPLPEDLQGSLEFVHTELTISSLAMSSAESSATNGKPFRSRYSAATKVLF